jgi:hypothetical protein
MLADLANHFDVLFDAIKSAGPNEFIISANEVGRKHFGDRFTWHEGGPHKEWRNAYVTAPCGQIICPPLGTRTRRHEATCPRRRAPTIPPRLALSAVEAKGGQGMGLSARTGVRALDRSREVGTNPKAHIYGMSVS